MYVPMIAPSYAGLKYMGVKIKLNAEVDVLDSDVKAHELAGWKKAKQKRSKKPQEPKPEKAEGENYDSTCRH